MPRAPALSVPCACHTLTYVEGEFRVADHEAEPTVPIAGGQSELAIRSTAPGQLGGVDEVHVRSCPC